MRLCDRIATRHMSHYGSDWQVAVRNNMEHLPEADTAYTTEPLGVHNDGTYFTQPPGLQARSVADSLAVRLC